MGYVLRLKRGNPNHVEIRDSEDCDAAALEEGKPELRLLQDTASNQQEVPTEQGSHHTWDDLIPLEDLSRFFQDQARHLKEYGLDQPAGLLDRVAAKVEESRKLRDLQELTLAEAAEESGYSYSTIQKHVADGKLENIGEKGNPRVRRGDLPRKVKLPCKTGEGNEPDLVDGLLMDKLSGRKVG